MRTPERALRLMEFLDHTAVQIVPSMRVKREYRCRFTHLERVEGYKRDTAWEAADEALAEFERLGRSV